MIRLIRCLVLASACFAGSAMAADSAPARFDFQSVGVSQVIGLVYMDAFKSPYVIAPEVLQDARLVSFRFDAASGDLRVFWRSFLDALGYVVTVRGGVEFIASKPQHVDKAESTKLFVYRPKHRSVRYLVDLLSGVFPPASFAVQRSVRSGAHADKPGAVDAPPGSAAALVDVEADVLLFSGSAADIDRFTSILPSLDAPSGEVVVKAIVYEVTTGRTEASAFSLAVSLLGGRVGVSVGGAGRLDDSLTIRTGSIDAALSAFKGDSRFKAVSTPSLRVKSGQSARLMVGQEVPTLGSVSYAQGSTVPVQSVEYRSSGVIFNLLPTVRDGGIDVVVDQQISDFAKTESGVNNSPTLTKRSLSTTVGMADGELVVLGGLSQDKASSSGGGQSFLPAFLRSSDQSDSRTEVLLMLQVTRVALVP